MGSRYLRVVRCDFNQTRDKSNTSPSYASPPLSRLRLSLSFVLVCFVVDSFSPRVTARALSSAASGIWRVKYATADAFSGCVAPTNAIHAVTRLIFRGRRILIVPSQNRCLNRFPLFPSSSPRFRVHRILYAPPPSCFRSVERCSGAFAQRCSNIYKRRPQMHTVAPLHFRRVRSHRLGRSISRIVSTGRNVSQRWNREGETPAFPCPRSGTFEPEGWDQHFFSRSFISCVTGVYLPAIPPASRTHSRTILYPSGAYGG